MHPKGIELANKAIQAKKIMGPDLSCPYYPCHQKVEDCTFCYCPFYPCYNPISGGKEITNSKTGEKVWDCSYCILPHDKKNAQKILDWLIVHCTKFEDLTHEDVMKLHKKLIIENYKKE